MPEDTFLADADAGKLDGIHLLGQSVTYPDASAFLDPRFGPGASAEFGDQVRRHRQGPRLGPGDDLRRQARRGVRQGERRDPRPTSR